MIDLSNEKRLTLFRRAQEEQRVLKEKALRDSIDAHEDRVEIPQRSSPCHIEVCYAPGRKRRKRDSAAPEFECRGCGPSCPTKRYVRAARPGAAGTRWHGCNHAARERTSTHEAQRLSN